MKLAANAVVSSSTKSVQVQTETFERIAYVILYHQRNIAASSRSHDRATRERLKIAGFDLPAMRCCMLV